MRKRSWSTFRNCAVIRKSLLLLALFPLAESLFTRKQKSKVLNDIKWLLEDTGSGNQGAWHPVSDDGHIKVWKRSIEGSPFVAIKARATVAATPEALYEVLTPGDLEIVQQYNPMVERGDDLEVVDRDTKISWSATMRIWPCRPRDFVTLIQRATLEDGSVVVLNKATTHPKAPVDESYVRAEILHGVFLIRGVPKDPTVTDFTMVHHFNPGGHIPVWLVNWLAEGKPAAFVSRLEKVAQKWQLEAAGRDKLPCRGRGFGDRPCAFLLSGSETAPAAALDFVDMEKMRWWFGAFFLAVFATILCAYLGSWSLGVRKQVE